MTTTAHATSKAALANERAAHRAYLLASAVAEALKSADGDTLREQIAAEARMDAFTEALADHDQETTEQAAGHVLAAL